MVEHEVSYSWTDRKLKFFMFTPRHLPRIETIEFGRYITRMCVGAATAARNISTSSSHTQIDYDLFNVGRNDGKSVLF